jgi:DNA-binding response OmpR family regulator
MSETGENLPLGNELVLLVEDQAHLRKLTGMILRDAGYRVLEASDGADGLRVIHAEKERIDLIISDVTMPEISGPEMIRRLSAELGAKLPPVLFLSGHFTETFSDLGLSVKKPHFLEKPYRPLPLQSKVRSILEAERDSRI